MLSLLHLRKKGGLSPSHLQVSKISSAPSAPRVLSLEMLSPRVGEQLSSASSTTTTSTTLSSAELGRRKKLSAENRFSTFLEEVPRFNVRSWRRKMYEFRQVCGQAWLNGRVDYNLFQRLASKKHGGPGSVPLEVRSKKGLAKYLAGNWPKFEV